MHPMDRCVEYLSDVVVASGSGPWLAQESLAVAYIFFERAAGIAVSSRYIYDDVDRSAVADGPSVDNAQCVLGAQSQSRA